MATQNDLINRTLFHLQATGAGQTASAEDAEEVRAAIQGKLDDLSERGVVSINDSNNFEAKYLNYLALCLANDLATGFGIKIDAAAIEFAETRLRNLSINVRLTKDTPPATYY